MVGDDTNDNCMYCERNSKIRKEEKDKRTTSLWHRTSEDKRFYVAINEKKNCSDVVIQNIVKI